MENLIDAACRHGCPSLVSGSQTSQPRRPVSTRREQACDKCRVRKTKCRGGKPCDNCRRSNSLCIFGYDLYQSQYNPTLTEDIYQEQDKAKQKARSPKLRNGARNTTETTDCWDPHILSKDDKWRSLGWREASRRQGSASNPRYISRSWNITAATIDWGEEDTFQRR